MDDDSNLVPPAGQGLVGCGDSPGLAELAKVMQAKQPGFEMDARHALSVVWPTSAIAGSPSARRLGIALRSG